MLYGTDAAGTYAINPVDGTISSISTFATSTAGVTLTFGNGMLYGANGSGTYAINPVDNTTTFLGNGFSSAGPLYMASMTYDSADNMLYGANSNGTYMINPSTGQATLLSSFLSFAFAGGGSITTTTLPYDGLALTYDPDNGMLYGMDGKGTYVFDPNTNSYRFLNPFASLDSSVQVALTYSPNASAVPIPASVWLFGSGLVGLCVVARARKRSKSVDWRGFAL